MKKVVKSILTVLLALPLFAAIFSTTTVYATEKTVPVTLHKVIFNDSYPEGYPRQNTGEEMADFGGEALPGAEFTVYDVTAQYHAAVKNTNQAAAQAAVIAAYTANPNDFTGVTSVITNELGAATFNLPEKNNGLDAVYLFIETKTPGNVTVTKKAAPIVLALPAYVYDAASEKFTDEKLAHVHLYPKNITSEDKKTVQNIDQFEVTTENGTIYNMERGQKIDFRLTLNIPDDIADVTYSVTDTPTDGLQFIAASFVASGLTVGNDYTLTSNADGGFTVTLNSESAKVQAFAGSTFIIDYQMELTKDLVPDAIEGNKATVKIGDTPQPDVTPKEKFQTGGKKIIKKDAHTEKTLAGAEFVVLNKDGKYGEFELNTAGTEYVLIGWADTVTNQSTITSLANGSVNVVGLKDGEYTLNETKAPSDKYVKIPDGTIRFVVKAGTYEEAQVVTVPNTPKGLLPSTGGSGIYVFLVVGAALMVGAYIWFRKSKTQAEV